MELLTSQISRECNEWLDVVGYFFKEVFMGFFSKMLAVGIETVLTPIDVLKDVATLGGVTVDRDEPYTLSRLKDIKNTMENALDDLKR